jgi:hypothetical protein
MKRLLREPLLQFLAIGLLLFWLFNLVSGARGGADRRIVLNDPTVAAITERFQSLWQRPPTDQELHGLLDTYIHEEVLYRTGLTLGLDQDDAVIRRRVLQKLDVISEEQDTKSAPSDADLEKYLQAHAARYARPAEIGLDQVLFDPARRSGHLEADVTAALARLSAGAAPGGLGDSSLLPAHVPPSSTDQITRDFGEEFVAGLTGLPLNKWAGPVRSTYGTHLVRITSMTQGRPATLADVREALVRDWEDDRRQQASADYYKKLRRNYDVVIEAKLPADVASGLTH